MRSLALGKQVPARCKQTRQSAVQCPKSKNRKKTTRETSSKKQRARNENPLNSFSMKSKVNHKWFVRGAGSPMLGIDYAIVAVPVTYFWMWIWIWNWSGVVEEEPPHTALIRHERTPFYGIIALGFWFQCRALNKLLPFCWGLDALGKTWR